MKKDELVHGFLKDCILQAEFKRGGKKKKRGVRDAKEQKSSSAWVTVSC